MPFSFLRLFSWILSKKNIQDGNDWIKIQTHNFGIVKSVRIPDFVLKAGFCNILTIDSFSKCRSQIFTWSIYLLWHCKHQIYVTHTVCHYYYVWQCLRLLSLPLLSFFHEKSISIQGSHDRRWIVLWEAWICFK
jgi:hypothetical protein